MPTSGDDTFSGDRAKAKLNECLDQGLVAYSRHFIEELANDQLTRADVLFVCRSGVVRSAPEPDLRTGRWKYRIEGPTVDRFDVAIVFTFRDDGAVLITVFKRNR